MGSSGDHGACAISRHLKVMLPSSFQKLCISGELARCFDGDVSSRGTAVLVSPLGRKVWPVQVGRDGDGAFLGNGRPEFVAAHGIGVGWFVVFRHEGGGVLTIKAFDTSCCLRDFSFAANQSGTEGSGAGSRRRPQFIKPILPGFTEKMAIPSKFVQNHMSEARTNGTLAVLVSLGTKFWRVELENDPSGTVFLAGGWSQFLACHGMAEGEALLLRHESNMVFTVKVFRLDGSQKNNFKPHKQTRRIQETEQSGQTKIAQTMTEQEDCPSSPKKCRNVHEPDSKEKTRAPNHSTSTKQKSSPIFSEYEVGPPSWLKREINASALMRNLPLPVIFCREIGLTTTWITLRTLTRDGAIRSWQVASVVCNNRKCHLDYPLGWMAFCQGNALSEGDVCTFNIIDPKLWHVDIERRLT